jgi:PAS domain S-box-containing protein
VKPFPLLRYYVATSLVVIVIITVTAAFLFVQSAERDFARRSTERSSKEASHFVQMFYEDIWTPAQGPTRVVDLEEVVPTAPLSDFARRITFGLDTVMLNVLDLDGRVLWSSFGAYPISGPVDAESYLRAVEQGITASQLQRGRSYEGSDGGLSLPDVVTTYAPLRDASLDAAEESHIVGVLEMAQDVTADLADARGDSLLFAVLGSVGMGTVLFVLLFLIVSRADRIITRGHRRMARQQIRLRESEERFRTVFESAPLGMAVVDAEGRFQQCNGALQKMVGRSIDELGTMNLADLGHPDDTGRDSALFLELVRGRRNHYSYEQKDMGKEGELDWAHVTVFALPRMDGHFRCVVMVEDVTERRRADETIREASRLASVGELAAGVAHELNNPLPGSARSDLERIFANSRRAARIVENLLSFSRKHDAEKRLVEVSSLIDRAIDFKSYELRVNNVDVSVELTDEVRQVMVDEHQMNQVLLNILTNAQHAATERGTDGRIAIRTERVGSRLRLSISDNGPGIDPSHLASIFTPFFTTKEVGKGTGLGLSLCYGIVQQHGGELWVESTPGEGATFNIDLPLTEAPVELRTEPEIEQASGTQRVSRASENGNVRIDETDRSARRVT